MSNLLRYYKTLSNTYDYLVQGYASIQTPVKVELKKNNPSSLPSFRLTENIKKAHSFATTLEELEKRMAKCDQCHLAQERKQGVVGYGCATPKLLIIGDCPSRDDELYGKPFSGPEGQFLDKWLISIGLARTDCYFTTLVKCRPTTGDVSPAYIKECLPYIENLTVLLKPLLILALGREAGQALTFTNLTVDQLRETEYTYQNIPVKVTYHPRLVLKNEGLKRPVWEDLKQVREAVS